MNNDQDSILNSFYNERTGLNRRLLEVEVKNDALQTDIKCLKIELRITKYLFYGALLINLFYAITHLCEFYL
jgi:hypothetical protein